MLYQQENVHGGDRYGRSSVLDFSANTNPLGTPPAVRRAVREAAGRLDQYPDPFCRELVSALSAYEGVSAGQILCGCGAAELIFSFCAGARPRTALETAPTFSEYSAALEAAGCRVDRFPLLAEEGFALGERFLDHLAAGRWDAVFLCNPNNPTGRTIDPVLLEKICGLCAERGTRLFVDECFLDLCDGGRALTLKGRLAAQPGLFLLKAFTKNYGMAGLRLGYCLSGDSDLLAAMSRTVQPWNVSIPAQAAGAAALGERAFLERAGRIIRRERAYLRCGLEALGLWVCPSQANYLLFRSPAPLFAPLLERGILVRDCANYHGLGPGWYRVAVRRRRENRQLLTAVAQALEQA